MKKCRSLWFNNRSRDRGIRYRFDEEKKIMVVEEVDLRKRLPKVVKVDLLGRSTMARR
jgi:hypothetical protein